MKKIFSENRIKFTELIEDTFKYIGETYTRANNAFTPSSVWGQLTYIFASLAQLIFYYIEDASQELNIKTASRIQSVQGLAQLGGHNATRAITAHGQVYLRINPSSGLTRRVIITNYSRVIIGKTSLPYLITLGQDSLEINLSSQRSRILVSLVQGVIEQQTVTGTGEAAQTFNIIAGTNRYIDNFHVIVKVNGEVWKKYDSWMDMARHANCYLCRTGINGGIDIIFGNGYNGRIPLLGVSIEVEYLVTNGRGGNIERDDNPTFKFVSDGIDENGLPINLNEFFTIQLAVPINFGTNPEPMELTKILVQSNSRSLVLANENNYRNFFERLNMFQTIDIKRADNSNNIFKTNDLEILLIPDISRRIRPGENYFTVPENFFYLSTDEEQKLENLIESSGQRLISSTIKFTKPALKKFAINIEISTLDQSKNTFIKNEIISRLTLYLINNKRSVGLIPKSEIISTLESIEYVDAIDIQVINQDIEFELFKLLSNDRFLETSIIDKGSFPSTYVNFSYQRKLEFIFSQRTFVDYYNKYFDSRGNIILNTDDLIIFRGGWVNKEGIELTSDIRDNIPGPVNFSFRSANTNLKDNIVINKKTVKILRDNSTNNA